MNLFLGLALILAYTLYFVWLIKHECSEVNKAKALASITPVQPSRTVKEIFFSDGRGR